MWVDVGALRRRKTFSARLLAMARTHDPCVRNLGFPFRKDNILRFDCVYVCRTMILACIDIGHEFKLKLFKYLIKYEMEQLHMPLDILHARNI